MDSHLTLTYTFYELYRHRVTDRVAQIAEHHHRRHCNCNVRNAIEQLATRLMIYCMLFRVIIVPDVWQLVANGTLAIIPA
jgi:hypothetical protein